MASMKVEVLRYVRKNGFAYELSAKMLCQSLRSAYALDTGTGILHTLPKKLPKVQRKTTQRRRIKPRVCLATPASRPRPGSASCWSSLCLDRPLDNEAWSSISMSKLEDSDGEGVTGMSGLPCTTLLLAGKQNLSRATLTSVPERRKQNECHAGVTGIVSPIVIKRSVPSVFPRVLGRQVQGMQRRNPPLKTWIWQG